MVLPDDDFVFSREEQVVFFVQLCRIGSVPCGLPISWKQTRVQEPAAKEVVKMLPLVSTLGEAQG